MNKTPILVTTVIPVYNGAKYLASCIEQIIAQSYKKLDIIVVDDGSTDATARIAQKYPVHLIQHERNRGLSAARNTGINAAEGDYIHFMDVDDAINPDFYREMVQSIVETGADIACSGMVNEPKPHRTMIFEKQKAVTTVSDKLKITNVGRWGFVVRYLFKMTLLNKHNIRFIEGRFIEDLPFSLTAVYHSEKLVVVPKAEYRYILRKNSIMTKSDRAHRRKRHRDMRFMKEYRHHFARKHRFKIPGVPQAGFLYFSSNGLLNQITHMTNSPLISVVIPAYNEEANIAQCIENILFQSYKKIEVIVVDNGSVDKTAEIAQQYSTIKYIREPKGGLSGARNRGMDVATGEYIHFMDADDMVTLNYHEKMVEAIIETEADIACSGFVFERFPTQTQQIKHKLLLSTTEDKILFTNVANYPACWRYLFKISFLKRACSAL